MYTIHAAMFYHYYSHTTCLCGGGGGGEGGLVGITGTPAAVYRRVRLGRHDCLRFVTPVRGLRTVQLDMRGGFLGLCYARGSGGP